MSTDLAEAAAPGPPSAPGPRRAVTRGEAVAAVLAAGVLFGTTGTAKALGPDRADAYVAGALRLLIGGPLLLLAASRVRGPRGARRAPLGAVALAGACVALYQFGFFAGLERVGVAGGTVIAIGSGPVFAGLLSGLALGEWPGRRWIGATALAVMGATLIGISGGATRGRLDDQRSLGIVLVLLAGFGYAAYTIVTRWAVARGVDGRSLIGQAFVAGGLMLSPALLLRPSGWVASAGGLATVVYLGVVPTFVAYMCFAHGIGVLDGPTVTTFVLAEPATAVLLAAVVLDERLDRVAWAGVAVVTAAMVLLALERRAPARP